jgi:hypothetical protein
VNPLDLLAPTVLMVVVNAGVVPVTIFGNRRTIIAKSKICIACRRRRSVSADERGTPPLCGPCWDRAGQRIRPLQPGRMYGRRFVQRHRRKNRR